MARTPFIAGNWKMNKTVSEAEAFIASLLPRVSTADGVDVALCVPFTDLQALVDSTRGSRVEVYAQNMHQAPSGAFTGEVSAPMLVELDVHGVVLGHSERRQLFGDTDEWVARKAEAALRADLTPIVCVGETLAEREAGTTLTVVERQVRTALSSLGPAALRRIVVAYEPVWAIGTGKVATPDQAQEIHRAIRGMLAAQGGPEIAAAVRILYGGSVKPDNIDALMAQPDLDGALVGGASLQAADFARIVRFNA